ncbi:hypothetical protein CJ179_36965 [Rhodococcus sp. ACS1]|nr:YncE family protein [Rhodococcus sp. ACS1]PBC39594.1 hypothetical protein CJ179_36965 [Rhodococcus sp. ACS1]
MHMAGVTHPAGRPCRSLRAPPGRRALTALALTAAVGAGCSPTPPPESGALPLQPAGEIALPGNGSRFDYESLDIDRGLLFIAHLGADEVIEVDLGARQVVRTVPGISQVHGVLVVPERRRVYATATGADRMVVLDEDTGGVLAQGPTGHYPDGLAYDGKRGAVWTTNKLGGSETVFDADTAQVRGTVDLGGEVGNVAYDPIGDQMLVAVQGHSELAALDPDTRTVVWRLSLPGCEGGHGLALDPADRLAFVACEGNATLVTVDLASWQAPATDPVGRDPDVLAYDPGTHRLYVAAESGTVTVFDQTDRHLTELGSGHLADDAHVVAVDPATGHTYYPVTAGSNGSPTLLDRIPTP